MATAALDPAYRRVSVAEFLAMDFGGARAELDDGQICMMAGGSEVHARVAANIIAFLVPRLRGTGCRPYGSDLGTRTAEQTVRLPDVSIYCNNPAAPGNERKQLLGDPRVVMEVLSPSTAALDQKIKLEEYRSLPGVHEIVLIDPDRQRVRLVSRTAPGGWADNWLDGGEDVLLRSLGISIPQDELFARD